MPHDRLPLHLFTVAFLARVVSVMGLLMFGPDSPHFLTMADWMREGRFQEALSLAYHPMYPLLIAITGPLAGGSVNAGHALSVILGSVAVLPLYHLLKEIFGRPSAFFGALIYACHPRIADVQADIMTESTYMCFFLLSEWLTWRMAEEPTLERGIVVGLAAAAAFLTRVEGILAIVMAIAWPAATLVLRRRMTVKGLGACVATLLTLLLVLSPYLTWVKSERGFWALSVRPSLMSAEVASGMRSVDDAGGDGGAMRLKLYKDYVGAILRLSLHGVLLPFMLVGVVSLRRAGLWKAAYFAIVTGGLLGGILVTIRHHNAMSDRYIMVGMVLLGGAAGAGLTATIRKLARRFPQAEWRPAACAGLVVVLAVLPGFRWLDVRRTEDLSYRDAARFILGTGRRPAVVSGTSQVAYLAGARSILFPSNAEELRSLRAQGTRCFVYDDRDKDAARLLDGAEGMEPPIVIQGPPKTRVVTIRFAR